MQLQQSIMLRQDMRTIGAAALDTARGKAGLAHGRTFRFSMKF
jgi:hypothetical protein